MARREGTHSPNLLWGLLVLFGLDLSLVFVAGSLPVRPTGASLPRAWTVLLLGPFFLIPLSVILAQVVLPVASFRDDVFPLVTIPSLRPSALPFVVSFPSCCGIQLFKCGPRYGFNLSTCTTLGLDRGVFWIRYTTSDKDAITKNGPSHGLSNLGFLPFLRRMLCSHTLSPGCNGFHESFLSWFRFWRTPDSFRCRLASSNALDSRFCKAST